MEAKQRPGRYDFVTDSAEYYRWYEYGGAARKKPLTFDELVAFLRDERGFTQEKAVVAAEGAF